MQFELKSATEILSQTPFTLQRMLEGLSDDWTASSGDRESWGVYDVIGHLIHGEETDWTPRAEMILAQGENRTFNPFDRGAQFESTNRKSLSDLLTEFAYLRNTNLERLGRMELTGESLKLKGLHPELGEVSMAQLLATWVVHDLDHIAQISGILAKKYDAEVGPWKEYLSILK
jgi:hypothetical protein